jgi:hypothetical protein
MAAPSDSDAYGKEHESVDLQSMYGKEPQVGPSGSDLPDATSQSPLAQARGTADPIDIGPGSVNLGMR